MPETPTIRIAPSLLDADFGHLAAQVGCVESAGADLLHIDVMDGHFVRNLSIGVPVVAKLRRHTGLMFDTHLMIENPGEYASAFVQAGSGGITFHVEAAARPRELVARIRDLGVRVGVALNPGTAADAVLDVLPEVDLVLVMTVWPGFGGQKFIRDCLPKIRALRQRMRPEQWLEVDGGVNAETAVEAVEAGADTLVAGTAIFSAPDPGAAVAQLRSAAMSVRCGVESRVSAKS